MRNITEPARQTPVLFEADVVVCGAGAAGIAAAVCAAREGLSVALIEAAPIPGGMVTNVTQWMTDYKNKGGFVREFITWLTENKAFSPAFGINKTYYNPFLVVPHFDELIAAHKIRVLYLTQVVASMRRDDGAVSGVIVESRAGRAAILGKVVIDATGDGAVAALSGAAYKQGRDPDGAVQAISQSQLFLNHITPELSSAQMTAIVEAAAAKSGAPYWYPYNHFHPFTVVGTTNTLIHTVPHATGINPCDAAQLSDALIECRRQALELFLLLKNNTEEFAAAEFGPFLGLPGVRESRRIVCDYELTEKNLDEGLRLDDGLFTVAQSVDIHRRDRVEEAIIGRKVAPYHFPYRSMLPRGIEGLLVIGRAAGMSHIALASCRMISHCMSMGEAAAIAARLSIHAGVLPRAADTAALAAEMKSRGYEI